jgi:hypothetical protein
MDKDAKYHFEQDRSKQAIKNNNKTYAAMNDRFDLLRPVFEKYGFHVYNCNPASGLKSFDYYPYDEAVKQMRKNMPADMANERTEGLYDRKAKEKEAKKAADNPKTLQSFEEQLEKRGLV